jgi:hypothetical protein
MKFEFKVETNPVTGEKMLVAPMQGELVSIAKEALPNSSGSLYYPATVKYLNVQDKETKSGCLVYANNFNYGMSVGTTYLGKIIKVAGKLPLIVLSHLDRASQATDDDFGIDMSLLEVVDFDAVAKK